MAVFSSLIALVATVTVGYMVYRGAEDSLMRAASDRVAHTAEIAAVRFFAAVEAIGGDVRFLAETPPVQGIVRARLLRGLDPMTAIRVDEWGEQLAEIFRAFLDSRTSYLQARFIGFADGGRELVRVELRGDEVVFVTAAELRSRGEEDYVIAAMDLPPGALFLSDVRWNNEMGVRDDVPVLYVSTPIHSSDGQRFGVVTISVDVRDVLSPLRSFVESDQTLYVSTTRGDVLLRSDEQDRDGTSRVDLESLFPAVSDVLNGTTRSARLLDEQLDGDTRGIAYFERLDLGEAGLIVGVTEPHETILAGVRRVRVESAIITLLLCIVVIAVALVMSQTVTSPLRAISQAAASFGSSADEADLPVHRNDEIGVLARSFQTMQQQIRRQMTELANVVRTLEDERASLKMLSATLEERVEERTSDLERVNRELESAYRELGEITKAATHDLQEPLRKLRSFADLLQREYGAQLGEGGRFYADRVFDLAERMATLISDLLAYSRVSADLTRFRRVDVERLVREVVSEMEPSLAAAGAVVSIDPLPTIDADPAQMRELIANLITNAVTFRRADVAPRVHVRARIASSHVAAPSHGDAGGRSHPQSPPDVPEPVPDDLCILEVEDNGTGFDEKYVERIFTPFERLHGESAGTGMGLAICRRIVENHQGTITARSEPRRGSTFIVRLPVRHGATASDSRDPVPSRRDSDGNVV